MAVRLRKKWTLFAYDQQLPMKLRCMNIFFFRFHIFILYYIFLNSTFLYIFVFQITSKYGIGILDELLFTSMSSYKEVTDFRYCSKHCDEYERKW